MSEEKELSGSQKEVLSRAFQNFQMAQNESKRVNAMVLKELGIPEKDFKYWVFANDLTKVVNQKPDPPKMPTPKMPKGNK